LASGTDVVTALASVRLRRDQADAACPASAAASQGLTTSSMPSGLSSVMEWSPSAAEADVDGL
jgi:hypothetical protein